MAEMNENSEQEENLGGSDKPQEPVGGEVEQQGGVSVEADKDARLWGMLCHLAGLAGFAFPIGNVILPLIFWQIKKDEYPFVNDNGKEAVNFQISMTLYGLISIPLFFVCVGPFLLAAVCIVDAVLLIIAAVKANNGRSYRYPLTIRLIK
jgi:uncharacterized Tic20 family protein